MPALDACHPHIVHALEKAGWIVSPVPFLLRLDRQHRLYIDIQARQVNDSSILVAEVKCFQDPTAETSDLYTAIGQYLVYKGLLEERSVNIPLYLVIPTTAYAGIFRRMGMPAVTQNHVKMMVVDLRREVIVRWLE